MMHYNFIIVNIFLPKLHKLYLQVFCFFSFSTLLQFFTLQQEKDRDFGFEQFELFNNLVKTSCFYFC